MKCFNCGGHMIKSNGKATCEVCGRTIVYFTKKEKEALGYAAIVYLIVRKLFGDIPTAIKSLLKFCIVLMIIAFVLIIVPLLSLLNAFK